MDNQKQLDEDALTSKEKDAVIASLKDEVAYLRREIDAWREKPTNAQLRAQSTTIARLRANQPVPPPRSRGVLFLDDNPSRVRYFKSKIDSDLPCTYVTTAGEAIKALANGRYTLVFLDHDLEAGEEGQATSPLNSGMTVAQYLAREKARAVYMKVIVHSLNKSRAQEMLRLLGEAGYACTYIPFTDENNIAGVLDRERELMRGGV